MNESMKYVKEIEEKSLLKKNCCKKAKKGKVNEDEINIALGNERKKWMNESNAAKDKRANVELKKWIVEWIQKKNIYIVAMQNEENS